MRTILTKAIARRVIESEILDDLPADDPGAVLARRDLKLLNALMFNARSVRGLIGRYVAAPPRRILEIGCGDGRFMLSVAGRLARHWPGVELVLLDRTEIARPDLRSRFKELGWRAEIVTADVFDWTRCNGHARFDIVTANLFLHHFDHAGLTRLFASLQPLAPLLLATEPCRAAFPLLASGLLPLLGASTVTVNDAPASIRAGFTGAELSSAWEAAGGVPLEERRAGLFTHIFAGASMAAVAG